MTQSKLPDDKKPGDPLTAGWVNSAAKNINAAMASRFPFSHFGTGGAQQAQPAPPLPPLVAAEITGNDSTDKWKHSWRVLFLDGSQDPNKYSTDKHPLEGTTTVQWAQTIDKLEGLVAGTPVFLTPMLDTDGLIVWIILRDPRTLVPCVVKESSASGARGSDDVSTATITYDVWEQCGDTSVNGDRIGIDLTLPACFRHTLTEYTPAPDDSVAAGYWNCANGAREFKLLWVCELVTNRCCASTT